MLLEGKKILIMGIRNKWSIAFGIAQSVYENGGKLIFTYRGESNKEKVKELVSEFKGSKIYALDDASDDEQVKSVFENIKEEKENKTMVKVTVNVEGMMCGHCEAHVNKAIQAAFGAEDVVSSHENGTTVFSVPEKVDEAKVEEVIKEAGYEFKGISQE